MQVGGTKISLSQESKKKINDVIDASRVSINTIYNELVEINGWLSQEVRGNASTCVVLAGKSMETKLERINQTMLRLIQLQDFYENRMMRINQDADVAAGGRRRE